MIDYLVDNNRDGLGNLMDEVEGWCGGCDIMRFSMCVEGDDRCLKEGVNIYICYKLVENKFCLVIVGV